MSGSAVGVWVGDGALEAGFLAYWGVSQNSAELSGSRVG